MAGNPRDWYGGGTYMGMGGSAEGAAQATNYQGSLGGTRTATPEATATGSTDDPISRAVEVGKKANPILAFFITLGVFCLIWWGMGKLEGDEGRRTIPFTITNVFVTGTSAVLFIFAFKNILTKWPLPGLTTVAHTI